METQQFQPAPVSPTEVPTIPNTQGQDLSQDEMKTNLKNMMDKIDAKYQNFQTSQFSYDNQNAQAKSQALREVFDLLQSAGVDPSNVEQVQQFLDEIKTKSPELYQQIEKVLQDLIGGDTTNGDIATDPTQQDQGTQLPLNMNINNDQNIPKNI